MLDRTLLYDMIHSENSSKHEEKINPEASRSFFSSHKKLIENPQILEFPIPGLEYIIMDGELLIKGENLFDGYLYHGDIVSYQNNESENEIREYLKTGDIVSIENGKISFKSRIKELINLSGLKYDVKHIENLLKNKMAHLNDIIILQCSDDKSYSVVYNTKKENLEPKLSSELRKIFKTKPLWILKEKILYTNNGKKIRNYEKYRTLF